MGHAVVHTVARPVPPVDRAVVQTQRPQAWDLTPAQDREGVLLDVTGEHHTEAGNVLPIDFQNRLLHPIVAEAHPRPVPPGLVGAGAGIEGLLEQGHPGLLPQASTEEQGAVHRRCQDRGGDRLGDVVEPGELLGRDLEVDLERAANDVRDRVSRTLGALPPDVDPPIVTKADANSSPIIFQYVRSEKRSLLELTELAENTFKERFQTIPGVSSVQVWGAKRYSIRLRMDPYKMAAYKLTPIDVYNAVRDNNLELPSGRVEGLFTELTVRTLGRLNTPEEFDNLILKEEGDLIVKFRDIGNAVFAPENERTILKKDGIPMVIVVVIPQPGSNAVEIAQEYYKRLAIIKKDLPADIDADVGYDKTRYILQSIDEVRQTVIVAFSLVALIIFLFLRDRRTT